MSRLTCCKHYIVSYINQCIDRTHPHSPDTALHFERRRFYRYSLHFNSYVTGAFFIIFYSYGEFIYILLRLIFFNRFKREIIKSRKFSCDTVMTPEVRTVSHGFIVYFNNTVIKVKCIGKISTRYSIKSRKICYHSLFSCRKKICKSYFG